MNSSKMSKKLFDTTIVYFIANFSTRIMSFLLLPLYTTYLTPADYGNVDLIFTFAQFLTPVITLNLTNATFRFLIDTDEKKQRKRIISSSFFVIFPAAVLVIIVSLIWGIISHSVYVFLGGLYIVSASFSSYIMQCYRGIKKNKTYAVMGVVSSFMHIILNILFVVGLSAKSLSLLLSPIIASTVVFMLLLFSGRFYTHICHADRDKDILKDLLKFSLPTVPETLIWWFLSGFAKTFLSFVHGPGMLGIYSVANKFSDLLVTLYSVFNMAWAEFSYALYKEKNRDEVYSLAFNTISRVMLSGVMILVPLTNVCVTFFLDESYHTARNYMPLLYIMAFINILSTYYGTGFQSAKNTNGILISSVIAVAINVPLCLVLIPYLGVWGAIISLFAANVSLLFTKKHMSKRFFTIKVDYGWFILIIPTAICCAAFYLGNSTVNIICLALSVVFAVIANFDLIKNIIYVIIRKDMKHE